MKKVLVIFPTIQEAQPVQKIYAPQKKKLRLESSFCFATKNLEFKAYLMGYGCEQSAQRIAKQLAEYRPDAALLIGYGGACSPQTKLGELFYATNSKPLADYAESFGGKPAKMKTCPKFAGHIQKQNFGKQGYGIAEMEYDFFEGECKKANVDFICLRIVSDTMQTHSPLEFFNSMMDEKTGGNRIGRALFSLLKKPSNIFLLKRFVEEISEAFKAYLKIVPEFIENLKL